MSGTVCAGRLGVSVRCREVGWDQLFPRVSWANTEDVSQLLRDGEDLRGREEEGMVVVVGEEDGVVVVVVSGLS